MWFGLVNRIRLRFKNIHAGGRVIFRRHRTAQLGQRGYFVIGAATYGQMSDRRAETTVTLDKYARLEVDHLTMGRGSRFMVHSGGRAKLGYNTMIADECFISVATSLTIGRDCLFARGTQIIDDDGHQIDNRNTKLPIVIGDHVWVGSRVTLLKGTDLGAGCVVAAGAVVAGKFPPNCLIGGVPARVLRENIHWK